MSGCAVGRVVDPGAEQADDAPGHERRAEQAQDADQERPARGTRTHQPDPEQEHGRDQRLEHDQPE